MAGRAHPYPVAPALPIDHFVTKLVRGSGGYTLMEVQIAMAFFLIVSAMSLAVVQAALPSIRVDSQVSRVMGLLQLARETAIAKQRDVALRFDTDTNTIDLVLIDTGGAETTLQHLVFEYLVGFILFEDMGDTPEGFGADSLVDFGGADDLRFISDGTFVDATSVPINGTIYMGITGRRETARAITITGSTARARFYKWSPPNETWEGGWSAR